MKHTPQKKAVRGYFTFLVLMVASLFLWYLSTLITSVTSLQSFETAENVSTQAFASAEAGLEYYRWHLSVFPSDLTDGTGHGGPYVHTVANNLGAAVGSFSLSIGGDVYCGTTTDVTITSSGMGTTSAGSLVTDTLFARYALPSVSAEGYVSAPTFNPSGTTTLLPTLESFAKQNGIFLPATSNGYQIVFNPDGSITASPVTAVQSVWGYSTQNGWQQENSIISTVSSGTTYTLPASCPLVFVDAPVWAEGTVSGRIALVSANMNSGGTAAVSPATNVFLINNITYENASGDGLTLIGQGNVLVDLQSPDIMELSGVYVALNGMFGRNEYLSTGPDAVPSNFSSDVTRTSLSVLGTVASNASSSVAWYGNGNFLSGYATNSFAVDESLAAYPPPFAPTSTTTPGFIYWQQEN